DLYNLSILDRQGRIKTARSMEGFVPGAAATFVLLSSAPPPRHKTAAVYYPGLAEEIGHRYSEAPYTGDGLSQAMRQAINRGPRGKIRKIWSSMNGEHFGAKEYGVSLIRNSTSFAENVVLEHPADCIGDIGAAFAPLLLGLASRDDPATSLVYCSSDSMYRSAVCVAT